LEGEGYVGQDHLAHALVVNESAIWIGKAKVDEPTDDRMRRVRANDVPYLDLFSIIERRDDRFIFTIRQPKQIDTVFPL